MYIVTIGLNHRTAPVEVREKMAFPENQLTEALRELRNSKTCRGCVILQTCNRTEIYAAVIQVEKGIAEIQLYLAQKCGLPIDELRRYLYVYNPYDAIDHLFRVAAGLDSMIPGETQILGQVRESYEAALDRGASNGVLNALFQQAIHTGKRVRTETKIDQNAISVGYAAVELARKALQGLDGRTALVVGAGKMAALTIEYLTVKGIGELMVCGRSPGKAARLAECFGGAAVPIEEMYHLAARVDLILSCTSAPHPVIRAGELEAALSSRRSSPLVIVDVAVPRDVEPLAANLPGVSLYDIDDLEQVVEENLAHRRELALMAEEIINEDADAFLTWLSTLSVIPTIKALKRRAERVKEVELQRAFNRLGPLDQRQRRVISALAGSIVNQLMHDPVVNLKQFAATHQGHHYAEILQKLFNLEIDPGETLQKRLEQGLPDWKEHADLFDRSREPNVTPSITKGRCL